MVNYICNKHFIKENLWNRILTAWGGAVGVIVLGALLIRSRSVSCKRKHPTENLSSICDSKDTNVKIAYG